MSKMRWMAMILLLVTGVVGIGCNETDNPQAEQSPAEQSSENTTSDAPSANAERDGMNAWLQMVKNGELPTVSNDGSFEWGLGYLVYYGTIDSTALDTLIYNGLLVHRRLETGEVTNETLSQNDQNLLELTEGIELNPELDPTEQIGQTPEIREAILERITQSQEGLSPDEALNSNEVTGMVALPSPEDLGGKYLVYTQETPDADFNFLGVVVVSDAVAEERASAETYSFQGWSDLPNLGDAAGPFWNELPPGVSGEPTNTDEGRPGVLLVSEPTYEAIKEGNTAAGN